MANRKIRHVTLMYLDFDSLVGRTPQEIYQQFGITCRLSKKRIFPASVTWNGYRVSEASERRITVELAQDGRPTAYFSFIPGPSFA
jgi:hypothetical protein